jgi:hypothetical protein
LQPRVVDTRTLGTAKEGLIVADDSVQLDVRDQCVLCSFICGGWDLPRLPSQAINPEAALVNPDEIILANTVIDFPDAGAIDFNGDAGGL